MKFFSIFLAAAVASVASAKCAAIRQGCASVNCCSGLHCVHKNTPGLHGAPVSICESN